MVGREDEMATLMRRWQRLREGDGQLVLIVGEPGLGKSRLIEEFHSRLADIPHTWGRVELLHPIAEWGRVRFRRRRRAGGLQSLKVRWRRSSSI
jgi:hypothetical protein